MPWPKVETIVSTLAKQPAVEVEGFPEDLFNHWETPINWPGNSGEFWGFLGNIKVQMFEIV